MKTILIIAIFFVNLGLLCGQEKMNLSRNISEPFLEFERVTNGINKSQWQLLNVKSKMKLAALNLNARIHNPFEFSTRIIAKNRNRVYTNYLIADNYFKWTEYRKSKDRNAKIKFDIYYAPFICVGEVTDVQIKKIFTYPDSIIIYQYRMQVERRLNLFDKLTPKEISFTFSTGHRIKTGKKYHTKPGLHLSKKYLVFLSYTDEFPYLFITLNGDEGFEIEDDIVHDPNFYFSNADKISLSKVVNQLDRNLKEILEWAEE